MSENLPVALLAGGALGALFFGGLWWTVRHMVGATRPGLWVLASLLLRMAIALTGFYVIGRDDWRRMLACLVGFMAARGIAQRMTRPSDASAQRALTGSSDAH